MSSRTRSGVAKSSVEFHDGAEKTDSSTLKGGGHRTRSKMIAQASVPSAESAIRAQAQARSPGVAIGSCRAVQLERRVRTAAGRSRAKTIQPAGAERMTATSRCHP